MKSDYPENDKQYYLNLRMNEDQEEWVDRDESDFESSNEEVAEWTDYQGYENEDETEIESSVEDQDEWDEYQEDYYNEYEEVWDEDESEDTSFSSVSTNETETCCFTCYFGQPLFVCRLSSPCLRCQLRNADIMHDFKLLSVVVNSQIHQLDNDLITRAQELWPQ